MNIDLTDAMVSDMDETADWMHSVPAPFPTIASATGIPVQRPPTPFRCKGLVAIKRQGISVVGREQGQADADRSMAIKRGGI